MNANELANELEACFTSADWAVLEAARQLRQQQVQIDILKTQLSYLESKVYGGTTK